MDPKWQIPDIWRMILLSVDVVDAVHLASTCTYLRTRFRNCDHIMKWQSRWTPTHICTRYCKYCTENSRVLCDAATCDLGLVKIFSKGPHRKQWALYRAARYNHTSIVQYLTGVVGYERDQYIAYGNAVRAGRIKSFPAWCSVLCEAARNGELEAFADVAWLSEYRGLYAILSTAALAGHLHILQWAYNQSELEKFTLHNAIYHAANCGHLHILDWWLGLGYGLSTCRLVCRAIINNRKDILDFIDGREFSMHHTMNTRMQMCMEAIQHESMWALEWLRKRGCVARFSRLKRVARKYKFAQGYKFIVSLQEGKKIHAAKPSIY